jgi:hypothetical protein
MNLAAIYDFSEPFRSRRDMATFVGAFETCSLPCKNWNHRAHLTVGLWYLSYHPAATALNLLRSGIQRYNLSCGWPTTARGGYHETLTRFWVWAIGCYRAAANPTLAIEAQCLELFQSRYGSKALPLEYYSRERLMSWEARVSSVSPDLCPLGESNAEPLSTRRLVCF